MVKPTMTMNSMKIVLYWACELAVVSLWIFGIFFYSCKSLRRQTHRLLSTLALISFIKTEIFLLWASIWSELCYYWVQLIMNIINLNFSSLSFSSNIQINHCKSFKIVRKITITKINLTQPLILYEEKRLLKYSMIVWVKRLIWSDLKLRSRLRKSKEWTQVSIKLIQECLCPSAIQNLFIFACNVQAIFSSLLAIF